MHIDDDHMYHGAALIQIAEDERFTAINSFKLHGNVCRSAYRINDDTSVYLKYASKPTKTHKEYVFTFHADHLEELEDIADASERTVIALVCVKGRHICCISYEQLMEMVDARRVAKGEDEEAYALLVTMPKGKSFRVYMNEPGVRNTMLNTPVIVSRNAFPGVVFE